MLWFLAILLHFQGSSGCHGDSLYSSLKQCLLEKKKEEKEKAPEQEMKPVLHRSQFQAGPHELFLLCLIKLKGEFVFTKEVMARMGSV